MRKTGSEGKEILAHMHPGTEGSPNRIEASSALFRPLAPSDADYIVGAMQAAVDEGVLHSVPDAAGIEATSRSEDCDGRIIESEGRRVGHVLLGGLALNFGILELRLLVMTERRKGFGRAAVRWAQRRAFVEARAHRLWLEVVIDNHAARSLCESCGFALEGIWRDGFPDGRGGYRDLALTACWLMSFLRATNRNVERTKSEFA